MGATREEDPKAEAEAKAAPKTQANAEAKAAPKAHAKANAVATAQPKAEAKATPTGPQNLRIYVLGGIGLTDDDYEQDPFCIVSLADKPDTESQQFQHTIQRETVIGKNENFNNSGDMSKVSPDDTLEFAVFEESQEDNEDDEEDGPDCIGIVSLLVSDVLKSNGFKDKL